MSSFPKRLPAAQWPPTQISARFSEQGLTLLECVVAIAVLGLTLTLITPPLFIAAATRAQNRQAEQAFNAAQDELSRIETLVAQDRHTVDLLPKVPASIPSTGLKDVPAPTTAPSRMRSPNKSCANLYDEVSQVNVNQALDIDIDGDCTADFFMQVFRTNGTMTRIQAGVSNGKPSDFQLAVRVYSKFARPNLGSLQTTPASLILTSGQGNQRFRPLAVIYKQITWGDQSTTLCDYHNDSNQAISTCAGVFNSPSP